MESSLEMLSVWVKLSLKNFFEPLEWFLQVEEPKKIRGKNWIESLQKFQRFYSPKKICFMHYHKTNGGCSS